jgi:uncharacterized protein (TIGR02466 family)
MIQDKTVPGNAAKQFDLDRVFAVPLARCFWPDSDGLNAELRRVILREMERRPGVVKTNRRGWQSESDMQDWKDECVREFVSRVRSLVRDMVRQTVPDCDERHLEGWDLVMWANVNQKGAFNTPHNHEGFGTIWSGFYYVDPGFEPGAADISGRTVFQDRSGTPKEILANPDPFSREIELTPRAGLMTLFPSPFYHYVRPYRGDRLRITIAFNLKHKGFAIPTYAGEPDTWMWRNFRGLAILPRKVPEKLHALALWVRFAAGGKLPRSLSPDAWAGHLRAAWARATAEASERGIRRPEGAP